MTPAEVARALVAEDLARAVQAAEAGDPDGVRTWCRWADQAATAWYRAIAAEAAEAAEDRRRARRLEAEVAG